MTLLLVCSGGGHLKQLHQLAPRFGMPAKDRLWVTFDSALSRTLLAGEDVVWARHAAPRDMPSIMVNALQSIGVSAARRITAAVSTGSSPAVSYLAMTAARGVPSHYIESAARAAGPSLTGRIVTKIPGVRSYTQYHAWESRRWAYGGSVFDAYQSGPRTPEREVRRVVVSLGTQEAYGFRSLVERLVPLLDGCEVLWQTAATDVSGLPVDGRERVPHDELNAAMAEADLVISHAGTGAALTALNAGHCPVLVPRRASRGEHVDDHQLQIAAELAARGLAVQREVDDLDRATLLDATARSVVRVAPPAFVLR